MVRFVMRQLVAGAATLVLIVSLTFFMLRLMPGGPFDQDRVLPPAVQQNLNARYRLDDPLWRQFAHYWGDLLQGDLGPSYKYQTRRVNDIVAEGAGVSLSIGLIALGLGTLAGTLLGLWAGLLRGRMTGAALAILGVAALSVPSFVFGGLLILVFSLWLGWLPAATLMSPAHYVLPVLTLSLVPFAYSFLLIRTQTLEIRSATYINVKRGYGLGSGRIATRHVLRNVLTPLLSLMGPVAAAVVTGSFVVEYMFAIPGLGRHFITAIANRDYTLIGGITLVYAVVLCVFNILSELAAAWLDPRLADGLREAA